MRNRNPLYLDAFLLEALLGTRLAPFSA